MDAMLDLETWGTAQGCAIRSIGAVAFDPTGDGVGPTFYSNIDDRSCWFAGLTVDPKTVRWWKDQPAAANEALQIDKRPLQLVVDAFHKWFAAHRLQRVWCQGANFDAPIWEAAARAVNQFVPWKFWNIRDTRTAYELAGFDPALILREGTHHNALDDCLHQVKCVQASYRALGLASVEVAA